LDIYEPSAGCPCLLSPRTALWTHAERTGCLCTFSGTGWIHFSLVLRLIDKPGLFAFLRIAAGGRLSCSAMASKVFVFDNTISSRSDFIDFHPRSDVLGGISSLTVRLEPALDKTDVMPFAH
jgi:hypothetical protein